MNVQNIVPVDAPQISNRAAAKRDKNISKRLLRNMQKRKDRVKTVQSSLAVVMSNCRDDEGSQAKRLRDCQILVDELVQRSYVLSPKEFASRKTVISDEPHYCISNFWSVLESTWHSRDSPNHGHEPFFFNSSAVPAERDVTIVHVDVTSDVHLEPSIHMMDRLISETVCDKADTFVLPLVLSPQFKFVTDIDFHVDTCEAGRLPLNSARHPRETYVMSIPEEDEAVGIVEVSSRFSCAWKRLLRRDDDIYFLSSSLHVVQCPITSVLLRCRKQQSESSISLDSFLRTDNKCLEYAAFMHGAKIYVSDSVRGCRLQDLNLSRLGNGVLVSRKPRLLSNGIGEAVSCWDAPGSEVRSHGEECC